MSFFGICVVLDCVIKSEWKFNKYRQVVFREAFPWRWQGKLLQNRAKKTTEIEVTYKQGNTRYSLQMCSFQMGAEVSQETPSKNTV